MNERVIRADGIELATQAFGDPGQPPLLLILGRHGVQFLAESAGSATVRARPLGIFDQTSTGLGR